MSLSQDTPSCNCKNDFGMAFCYNVRACPEFVTIARVECAIKEIIVKPNTSLDQVLIHGQCTNISAYKRFCMQAIKEIKMQATSESFLCAEMTTLSSTMPRFSEKHVTHERESSSSHQNFTTTDATTQTSVISSTLNNSIALINNSSMHNNDTSAFNSTPIPHDYTKSLTSPVTTITLHESTPRAHSVEQTTPFTKSNNTMPDTTRFNTNVTLSSVNTSSHDFSPYTSKLTDSTTTDLYAEMSTISLKNIEARGTKYDKLRYRNFIVVRERRQAGAASLSNPQLMPRRAAEQRREALKQLFRTAEPAEDIPPIPMEEFVRRIKKEPVTPPRAQSMPVLTPTKNFATQGDLLLV
uniref:Uncharacterized protein n=1 Tax=Magallana gigas TaxID=29159 RepID=A0A8W8MP39_MAGGI